MAVGRPPKPEGMKAGHGSKASTRAVLTLEAGTELKPPPLPPHPLGIKWHALCLQTWADIWSSPMASQYVAADVPGLFRIIVLTQSFMDAPSAPVSAELRQLSFNYGLSPMDRRRLQWTIVKADEAMQQADARRGREATRGGGNHRDPREALT